MFGLLDVVERGLLRRSSPETLVLRAFRPSAFDRELLRLAEAAVGTKVPTALVLPVPGTKTSVLLAASILVAHFSRSRTITARIGVATRQLALRAFYDTLHFGKESLCTYFPRTVVGADGCITDVGRRSPELQDKPGRMHFATELSRFASVAPKLHGIVVEAGASDADAARQFLSSFGGRFPLIYLTPDGLDPVLTEFEATGAVWAWDAAWLAELAEGADGDAICVGAEVLEAAGDTEYDIRGPAEQTELDAALARLWDDLAEIQHHPGGATFDAVQWVWGVFGALSQLVVPVEAYDRRARVAWGTSSVMEAPVKAIAFAKNALRVEDREYWQLVASDLEDAVSAAARTNPKPAAVADWVGRMAASNEEGTVVVRNRAAREALGDYLQARPDIPFGWHRRVRVVTQSEALGGKEPLGFGGALITGPLTSFYSPLLAVPSPSRVTILTHGPWETVRAVKQLTRIKQRLEDLARGQVKVASCHRLFGKGIQPRSVQARPLHLTHTETTVFRTPRQAADAVWDPFDIKVVRDLGRRDADTEGPARSSPEGAESMVMALCVRFDDGTGFFEPDVQISRIAGADVRFEVAAKALEPGDRVLLVDHGARRGLFDVLVEKLESLPELGATVMLIREWQERARRAWYESGLTHAGILSRMGPDARVTTPGAVGHWIRGFVMGPDDPEDIRRFGEAVGDQFLSERWEAIGRALETARTQRRKWGRMLASVLTGLHPAALEDDGYFDRRLGIHYSDLAEAVSMHTVTEVSGALMPVPYAFANRLLPELEAAVLERTPS